MEHLIQTLINGALMGCIYALIALGLSIIFGVMNVVNFAHGDFVMIAMYGSYTVGAWLVMDAVATPLITVPLLFVFGVLTYYVLIDRTLRERYVTQIAVTVGLAVLLRAVAQMIWQAQPRSLPYSVIQGNLHLGDISILMSRLVAALVSVLAIMAISLFLMKTWPGRAIRAASDDLDAASLVGVSSRGIYALCFGLGTSLTALAGGLLMSFQQVDPTMGLRFGLLSWCVLALAGLGSLPGLLISGMIVGAVESLAITYGDPRARLLAIYLIFILVLWLRPRGLFGRK